MSRSTATRLLKELIKQLEEIEKGSSDTPQDTRTQPKMDVETTVDEKRLEVSSEKSKIVCTHRRKMAADRRKGRIL